MSDERLAQFDLGGFVAPDDVAELVASEVAPILAGSEDRVLLVPDPVASPGDAFLKQETMRHVVVGGGVYYVEGSAETERLVTSWRAGASAAGQMAIVSSVGHELMRDELDLQRAADASVVLVFEAYDGYGALFLTRHGEAFRLPD